MPATYELVSPKYSFVDFNPPANTQCCEGKGELPLPIATDNDLQFQVNADCSTIDVANNIMANADNLIQLKLLSQAGEVLHDWTSVENWKFKKYRTSEKIVTFLWYRPLTNIINLVPSSECFSLRVMAQFDIGAVVLEKQADSNLFHINTNSCYTSLLEYINDEDYAGFNYCAVIDPLEIIQPVNRVRLYIFPSRPKIAESKVIYRKSNGIIKQRSSLLTKQYLFNTEYFSEITHEKLSVALAHDIVTIASNNYNGGISKNGEYEINWDTEINECIAPASFTALATSVAIMNSNCSNCDEVVPPDVDCVSITAIQYEVNPNDPEWSIIPGPVVFSSVPLNNQIVTVYYQLPGGPVVNFGTYSVDTSGTIITSELILVDNSINSIILYAVAECSDSQSPIETVYKPGFCAIPTTLQIEGFTVSAPGEYDAAVSFVGPNGVASGGYEWQLWDQDDTIMLNSGVVGMSPNPQNFTVPSIPENDYYILKLRSNCGAGNLSEFTTVSFNTFI